MPKNLDIELDIETAQRVKIINYLKQKYGENNVLRPVTYDIHKIPHPHASRWIIKKNGDVLPVSKMDGKTVAMYEAAEVDKLQLFNVDLLGLNVLSDIKDTVSLIKERYNIDIVFNSDKCDDEKTFSLINFLDTEDVFFLSGDSFKRLIKNYPVNCLNDISFIMALCRPPFIESSEICNESPTELSKYLTETRCLPNSRVKKRQRQ